MSQQHLQQSFVRRLYLALASTAVAAGAQAVTPVPFTPNNPIGGAPVGWAFAGNKFVGSILGDGVGRLYSTDLSGGNVQPFGGTLSLSPSYGFEHYITGSPGLGGFPQGDLYVAEGNNIRHISNAGVADPGPFVTGSLGGLIGDVRGIMFDTVGTFGYQMIATTHDGYVYTIDNTGNPTQIAFTGEDTEGLDIAPLGGSWGSQNGWLFVASEGSGTIRAIKPVSLAMQNVATVPSAEQLAFVPLNLGASGNPLEGLYSANYSVNVLHAGASQFAGMQGDIIVTGETTQGIYNVDAINGVTTVGAFPNQPEDGLFITADLLAQFNVPEPASLSLLALGSAMMLRRRK